MLLRDRHDRRADALFALRAGRDFAEPAGRRRARRAGQLVSRSAANQGGARRTSASAGRGEPAMPLIGGAKPSHICGAAGTGQLWVKWRWLLSRTSAVSTAAPP